MFNFSSTFKYVFRSSKHSNLNANPDIKMCIQIQTLILIKTNEDPSKLNSSNIKPQQESITNIFRESER